MNPQNACGYINSRTRIYPFTLGQAAPTRGLFLLGSQAQRQRPRQTKAAGSGVASLPHSKTEGLRPNPDKGGDYGNDRNLMHRSDNFLYFATELSFLAFAF